MQDNYYHINSKSNLCDALAGMVDPDEVSNFLQDILTIEELREVKRRFAVAGLLEEGMTYREISKMMGISTATITKIKYMLQCGKGGYNMALSQLKTI